MTITTVRGFWEMMSFKQLIETSTKSYVTLKKSEKEISRDFKFI